MYRPRVAVLSGDLLAQAPNPWFDPTYFEQDRQRVLDALQQHVTITLAAVLLGIVISLPLALLARRNLAVETAVIGAAGIVYTIPSLALFGFLVPYTGFTERTAILALGLYTLVVLVRNTVTGLAQVPPDVVEAAQGMGLSPTALLVKVELPIALPSIMAGIRIATVSTISLLTVAAYVGTGGFGQLIDEGFRGDYKAQVMTGVIGCVGLALIADALLVLAQRLLTPWSRAGAARAAT